MLWVCTFIRETPNFLPTNDIASVWLWRAHLFKHVHAQLRQTKVLSLSLKMILLRKIWRCAEMTRGLTARAGPCSRNPLLNAVKQAGNKKILFRNSKIPSFKSISLKKKTSANGNPRNPGDQLIPAEKLEEKCFNCRCTRIKDPQVELGLFRLFGDHRSLVQDQRFLDESF